MALFPTLRTQKHIGCGPPCHAAVSRGRAASGTALTETAARTVSELCQSVNSPTGAAPVRVDARTGRGIRRILAQQGGDAARAPTAPPSSKKRGCRKHETRRRALQPGSHELTKTSAAESGNFCGF